METKGGEESVCPWVNEVADLETTVGWTQSSDWTTVDVSPQLEEEEVFCPKRAAGREGREAEEVGAVVETEGDR
mgnify:CR=1 FL=1